MTDAQREAYEASKAAHKKALALAYKLGGGRLNEQPRRRDKPGTTHKVLR